MSQNVVKSGSSVLQVGRLHSSRLDWGKWHRSKDTMAGDNPFGSFMLNKKWTLEEEFNNHMMRFQQVTVSSIYPGKLDFDLSGWIDCL